MGGIRHERGYVAVFGLMMIAYLSAIIGAGLLVVGGSSATPWWMLGCGLTMWMVGSRVEMQRDALALATFIAGLTLPTSMVLILYACTAGGSHPVALGTGVSFGLVGIGATAFIIVERRRPPTPEYPEILREHFSSGSLCEIAGVYMVTTTVPGAVLVLLENGYLGCRKVTVKLHQDRLRDGPSHARFARATTIELGPAEVGKLTIPVHAGQPSSTVVYLVTRVRGSGGRRVRRREAIALRPWFPVWVSLLLTLLLQDRVEAGGVRLEVPAEPDDSDAPAMDALWEVVWQPAGPIDLPATTSE